MFDIDTERLHAAYGKARQTLLAHRTSHGHWEGELSTSALSTATAVSALSLANRHTDDASRRAALEDLIIQGVQWLADQQNADGGWGDTDRSYSNISTTMLAVAAFRLTGFPADHVDMLTRAQDYIQSKGGVDGLKRRYGRDKTFAVPILANCAMAGIVPWRTVSPLPFELACFPQSFYRFLRMPVVSYAIPALVAIGQARYFHAKPWNPLSRLTRALSVEKSLSVLEQMQPASGGYLEAVPLTSFVVMSLASIGRADCQVAQKGIDFLISSFRPDGSWPIDTNLATWNTSLSLNALAAGGEDVGHLECHDWLLDCQYKEVHPFTGAEPGGWGWSDLSGAVPDADDTPGALLALANLRQSPSCSDDDRRRFSNAAWNGIKWLVDLQNSDGGWPTFCRGWGKLPFDRSGSDLTAHVLRAFRAWRDEVPSGGQAIDNGEVSSESRNAGCLNAESRNAESRNAESLNAACLNAAARRGFEYLARSQNRDGSWAPLWFGNQDEPGEENPVYGTSKVLLAYRDCGQIGTTEANRGLEWLSARQNTDGGWGGGASVEAEFGGPSTVEETALAIEALLAGPSLDRHQTAVTKGLQWLMEAVETDRYLENAPIGFYFAKLWYHEQLYPLIFTTSALGHALSCIPAPRSAAARLTC